MQREVSFGPYVLVERIGLGARSEVFRARRRTDRGDESFALKRALAGAVHDRETQAVLFGEAELLGKLDHEGVVRVRDFGSMSGVPFVAYELVDGVDLEKLLSVAREKGKPIPRDFALTVAMRVAAALDYVHGYEAAPGSKHRPIVHRDVGPSNVLVGFDGKVKLADFGIAKVPGRSSTTGVGEIKGTIRYMSPEQLRGDELDPRTDLYSLGALLLEMTTGRMPFEGLRPVDVLQELARGGWLDPDAVAPNLDEPIREVLRKVLAREPTGRYDTSAKVLDALSGLVEKLGAHVGDEAVARFVRELFPARPAQTKKSEESHTMADEKGGSDLDVFEGLAKKSVRPSNLPGSIPASSPPPSGRVSGLPAPVPPPPSLRSGAKSTLLGVPVPPLPGSTATPLPLPPPSVKPPIKTMQGQGPLPGAVPPPTSSGSSSPSLPLPPPVSIRNSTNTPLPPPASVKSPSAPPPPKPPSTLVAAVPPPPKPPVSIGSAVGMPAEETEEKTPPAGTAVPAKAKGASVEMDWTDDEESTHVFEKKKHAMQKASGPRPAAGEPAGPTSGPVSGRVGNAATLLMASGGQAAPRSVPPPPAIPQKTIQINEPPAPTPPPAPVAATPAPAPSSYRKSSEEQTVVRPRESGGSKLGVILGGLALVAVVVLGVILFMPRKGDLKISIKSKSGEGIGKIQIYVDGVHKCDTTPCLVRDLDAGARTVKVMDGDNVVAEQIEKVEPGKELPVNIQIETQKKDGPAPTSQPSVASTQTAEPVTTAQVEGTGFKVLGPKGVKVLVDGKEKATLAAGTAYTVTDLAPGEHTIKLDGGEHYKSFEKKITVTKGKMEDLGEQKLAVVKGLLTVDLKTEGAQILLSGTRDGKKFEKKLEAAQLQKPLSISADETWKITAKKTGFEDFSQDIKFDDGAAEKTITVELLEKGKPKPPTPPVGTGTPPTATTTATPPTSATAPATGNGTISINSIPISNAIVDGRPVGKTPTQATVPPGKHTVTFRHPEKGTKSVTVDVKPGGKAVASVRF